MVRVHGRVRNVRGPKSKKLSSTVTQSAGTGSVNDAGRLVSIATVLSGTLSAGRYENVPYRRKTKQTLDRPDIKPPPMK
jgi:hypothetical protein